MLGAQPVHQHGIGKGETEAVVQLRDERAPERLPVRKHAGVARFQPQQLAPVLFHASVAQRHFQHSTKVDLAACRSQRIPVGHADLGAAGGGIVKDILFRSALGQMQRNNLLVIEQLGITLPHLDGFRHLPQEALGRTSMNADGQIRIRHGGNAARLQNKIAQFVGGVETFPRLAADGHGLPVGIAFLGGHCAGRQCKIRELSHLEPQTVENLQRAGGSNPPLLPVLPVIGPEQLIHAAIRHNAPRALFKS